MNLIVLLQPLPWQGGPASSNEKSSGGFKASIMACFVRKPQKQQETLAYSPASPLNRDGFHLSDHTSQTIAHLLTLIQQVLLLYQSSNKMIFN